MLSTNIYLFNVSNREGNIKRSCNAQISNFHYIYCLAITSRFQYSELINAYKNFVAFPYLNVFKKYVLWSAVLRSSLIVVGSSLRSGSRGER